MLWRIECFSIDIRVVETRWLASEEEEEAEEQHVNAVYWVFA